MANMLFYYLIVINVVTFLVYGIDKRRSTSGRLLPTGRKKAKQGSWRISEATLLTLAVISCRPLLLPVATTCKTITMPWLMPKPVQR